MCDPYILYSFERSIFQAVDMILAILLLLFLFYDPQTVIYIIEPTLFRENGCGNGRFGKLFLFLD